MSYSIKHRNPYIIKLNKNEIIHVIEFGDINKFRSINKDKDPNALLGEFILQERPELVDSKLSISDVFLSKRDYIDFGILMEKWMRKALPRYLTDKKVAFEWALYSLNCQPVCGQDSLERGNIYIRDRK